MSEIEEHDLKKSEDAVGQLLPVIKDAHGKIVDGLHRIDVDADWRTETRPEIKTEEDYWKVRAHLNYSRRNAQEEREEKLKITNSLAEYYMKQGLKVSGAKPPRDGSAGGASPQNEVLDVVIKALDGAIPESWIRHNIDPKYLQKQERKPEYDFAEPDDEPAPYFGKKEKAIDYLKADKKTVAYRYGKDFVDRLEKEMKEEVKKELMEDPEFVVEAISKTPEIITPEVIEKIGDREEPKLIIPDEKVQEIAGRLKGLQADAERRSKDPKLIERGKLVKNWMAHNRVRGILESLRCPTCGADSSNLIWKCHGLTVEEAFQKIKEKLDA